MKTKITAKRLREMYPVIFECGACDMQNILHHKEPAYYNSGVYGWNCDAYTFLGEDVCIVSGYRPFNARKIPRDVLKKYDTIARNILGDITITSYGELCEKLEENASNFIAELLKGGN